MGTYDDMFLAAMTGEENFSQRTEQNEVLKGKLLSKEDKGFFVAMGGKTEMILPFSEMVSEASVGDEVEVAYNGTRDGIPQVSQKKALRIKAMEQLSQSMDDHSPVVATVKKVITNKESKSIGYSVDVDGVEAFLHFSQIRVPQQEKDLIGQKVTVVVTRYERGRFDVSEKVIREKLQKENFSQFISQYQIGDRVPVVVSSIADSYTLVSGASITMFLHITLFDWKYVKNLNDVLKIGDNFDVIIHSIDTIKQSVKVSRKDAMENPIKVFLSNKRIGDRISANVVRFARSVAILEDSTGVDLILPVGEMSWIRKISDPKHLLNIGDRVEVTIKDLDFEKQRVIVSLRELLENPWDTARDTYAMGTTHKGNVTSITDFGIFIVFEDGIQGLIRKEDIEWSNENIALNEKFQKGGTVTAMVLNIDSRQEKLRLGIKQLSQNPYQEFADKHKVGSVVSAQVTELIREGVEVVVEGLPAFIHISQLSSEMVNDVKDVCKVGDNIQAAVRRINVGQQNIELSIKDLTKAEEQKAMDDIIGSHKQEIPTLGSILGDALKK